MQSLVLTIKHRNSQMERPTPFAGLLKDIQRAENTYKQPLNQTANKEGELHKS
jgi:hypothetical protein